MFTRTLVFFSTIVVFCTQLQSHVHKHSIVGTIFREVIWVLISKLMARPATSSHASYIIKVNSTDDYIANYTILDGIVMYSEATVFS